MSLSDVLSSIDSEISRLEQARAVLATDGAVTRRGKPSRTSAKSASRKRTLSPEARERIAAAQRKRWAAQKKSAR